jgi:hypothetical protein
LAQAARLAGYEWWWTGAGTDLAAKRNGAPLVAAVAGLAEALRAGQDPDVLIGGDSAELAVEVAGEWLAAGIAPRDIGGWVRAGCWRPAAARAMAEAGIRPAHLLRDGGAPRDLVDSVSGWPIPLARAVADDEMTADAALAHLRSRADSHRVRIERVGGAWRIDVECPAGAVTGAAPRVGEAPNLREAEGLARALIAEGLGVDAAGVFVVTEVCLPAAIRSRIDRAAQLRDEGTHPASDPLSRRLALDAAAAELRDGARELAELGVTVADVAELLQVTTREAHDLLREA